MLFNIKYFKITGHFKRYICYHLLIIWKMPRTHNVEDMSYDKNSLQTNYLNCLWDYMRQYYWCWDRQTNEKNKWNPEIDLRMYKKKISAKSRWFQIHREKMLYSIGGIGAHLLKKKSVKRKLDVCFFHFIN